MSTHRQCGLNDLFSAWILAEVASALVLMTTFIESLLAWRYDLQPLGYLNFQMLKLCIHIAWVIVVVSAMVREQVRIKNYWGLIILLLLLT